MRIRIVQCLCGPQRHAILALAVKDAALADDQAIATLQAAVVMLLTDQAAALGMPRINPWCGLCGAIDREWQFELGWSQDFPDWETALRVVRQCEADQRGTAALLELLDATVDAQLRRAVDDAHAPHKPPGKS